MALNIPEHRADDLLLVDTPNPEARWALLLEVQARPDPKLLRSWRFKATAAEKVLDFPVILAVLYLERGEYATFPDTEFIRGGTLQNTYGFETVRLWEHGERIANGELPELAPLLLLASAVKTEAVLQQERELILNLPVSLELQRDLLAVAMMVGQRYFQTETLERIFREELAMLKEAGFIQEWIDEGEARGRAEGAVEGETRAFRVALTRTLTGHFGPLSADIQARINELSAEQALEVLYRAPKAQSLADLGF